MMTADEGCIGSKYGIAFAGKWVWKMKDYIDRAFMKLFDPNYLFDDYKNNGTSKPLENNELFDDDDKELQKVIGPIKERVKTIDARTAGELLSCGEEETDFHERFQILMRMHTDKEFELAVVKHFNPPYLPKERRHLIKELYK